MIQWLMFSDLSSSKQNWYNERVHHDPTSLNKYRILKKCSVHKMQSFIKSFTKHLLSKVRNAFVKSFVVQPPIFQATKRKTIYWWNKSFYITALKLSTNLEIIFLFQALMINQLKDKMLHTNRDYKITRGHVVSFYPLTSRPCSTSMLCFSLGNLWKSND